MYITITLYRDHKELLKLKANWVCCLMLTLINYNNTNNLTCSNTLYSQSGRN